MNNLLTVTRNDFISTSTFDPIVQTTKRNINNRPYNVLLNSLQIIKIIRSNFYIEFAEFEFWIIWFNKYTRKNTNNHILNPSKAFDTLDYNGLLSKFDRLLFIFP